MELWGALGNREKAVIVWSFIILVILLVNGSTRKSLLSMLWIIVKTFSSRQVAPLFLSFLAYICLLLFLEKKIHLWNFSLLKDTIIWFMGTAIILFINSADAGRKDHFFKKEVMKNLKFTLILVFLINFYTFNFYEELLFVPFITLVILLSVVSDMKTEYLQVKKTLQAILALLSFILVAHAFTGLVNGFHDFESAQTVREFFLAPVLTVAILPFVYLLAVYSSYEVLFVQLRHRQKNNKQIVRYAMWRIVKVCRLRLSNVSKFSKDHYPAVGFIESESDVDGLIERYVQKNN